MTKHLTTIRLHAGRMLCLLPLLFMIFSLMAQNADSVSYPNFKVDGTLKTKFERISDTNMSRFTVRNSRIGVRGNINDYSSYRVQVELCNDGKFSVLDVSGTLNPTERLSLTLGQTTIPLFNDQIITPSKMIFSNLTFLGKYFLNARDLGAKGKYAFNAGRVPVSIEAGLFNGNVINNPMWKNSLAYGGRLELGSMKGFRFTTKAYDYPNNDSTHFVFYGADLRYEAEYWKVETEIMQKKSKTIHNRDMLSYYIQGSWNIPIQTRMYKFIRPAIRWDAIDEQRDKAGFDVNRLTTGIGFGFNEKKFSSVLLFEYEWYFVNHEIQILSKSTEIASSKSTIELLFTF
ncbi:MAG: hypothetical protein ABFD09_13155 [Proteiniphilum sp.]